MALDTLAHVGRGEPLKEYETFEFFGVNNAALQVVCPLFLFSPCRSLSHTSMEMISKTY